MREFTLGLLGNPVDHSRSPDIHQQFAEETGISLSYEKVLVSDAHSHLSLMISSIRVWVQYYVALQA